jgi:alpha-N-arabinofuranosidase
MYAGHQGGQSVRTIFSAPLIHYERDGQPATFWGLKGSASLHEKELVLTVVNPNVSDATEAEIAVRGASIKSGTATTLTNPDIHAHNTFEQRDAVKPQTSSVEAGSKVLRHAFPAASVTTLKLALA